MSGTKCHESGSSPEKAANTSPIPQPHLLQAGRVESSLQVPWTHPAGLCLLPQSLDAAAIGGEIRHQSFVLLQESLKAKGQGKQGPC